MGMKTDKDVVDAFVAHLAQCGHPGLTVDERPDETKSAAPGYPPCVTFWRCHLIRLMMWLVGGGHRRLFKPLMKGAA